jgi:membrane protein
MNVAYDETEKRSFFELTLVSFAFTLAALFAVILTIGVLVVLPLVLNFIGLGETAEWVIRAVSYLAIAVLFSLGVASLYRWGPSRNSARWHWITPGAVLTVVVVALASVLFSWYVANFGSYNATYGSLGALIGFMTWIWISVTILIVGGELNSEIEHQTARDSTVGPEQPIGHRGAVMADTIGRAVGAGDDREVDSLDHQNPTRNPATAHRPLSAGAFALALTAGMLLEWRRRRTGNRTSPES